MIYEQLSKPPGWALKQITGGRLRGMTDINPQWRYQALTEAFGMCGVGWRFSIDELWMTDGTDGQKTAWARISLFVKDNEWSEPIPGIGGSTYIAKESSGLYTSDEAYKMAVTDALSTACKMIGVGADIYAGKWDGSKYRDEPNGNSEAISEEQLSQLIDLVQATNTEEAKFNAYFKIARIEELPASKFQTAKMFLESKLKKVSA